MADTQAEKNRLIGVLRAHADVNSDHAMHGWACSCGWGEPTGEPPWRRHSHDEFLHHVADVLLSPEQSGDADG